MATDTKIPEPGSVLLSEPFMPDVNFKRSVVLLCEHQEEGSVGFILNRPLGIKINEAIESFPHFDAELFLGGPVQTDTLHYIHRLPEVIEGSVEVIPGLYWGGNFENIKILIETNQITPDDIRFFLGYSGWGEGQLQDEMKERSWIVSQTDPTTIFDHDIENLWKHVLQNMGGQYQIMSNFPESPLLN